MKKLLLLILLPLLFSCGFDPKEPDEPAPAPENPFNPVLGKWVHETKDKTIEFYSKFEYKKCDGSRCNPDQRYKIDQTHLIETFSGVDYKYPYTITEKDGKTILHIWDSNWAKIQ